MNNAPSTDKLPRPGRETPPPGYDPDWPSESELNPSELARRPGFFRGLIVALCAAAAALLLVALPAGATGCASAPPGAWDEATNAAARAAVAIREAPTNEWWRTFPETEEEYLALCEPKIQEKLLDYPEEERERMYDLLVSEASTAYLFQSIYAAILRNDENPARDEPRDSATTPEAPAADPAPAPPSTTEHAEGDTPASASAPAPVLDFRYGGFRGGSAKEDSRCRISKLKVGANSISLHWDTRIPSDWARETGEKGALVVVAAFYQSGDRWIGGKFDWIDESRPSRSLENVHGGYGGWDAAAWSAAKMHAVCVVSADGKWRSNLLEETK